MGTWMRYKTEVGLTHEQQIVADRILGSLRSLKNRYVDDLLSCTKSQAATLTPDYYNDCLTTTIEHEASHELRYIVENTTYEARRFALTHTQRALNRRNRNISKDMTHYYKNHQKVKYHCKITKDAWITENQARIPRIGIVEILNPGYLPQTANGRTHRGVSCNVTSMTLMKKGDKYYLSVQVITLDKNGANDTWPNWSSIEPRKGAAIGLDLGVKILAQSSNGTTYPNINKESRVKRLIQKQKTEIEKLNRKIESRNRKMESGIENPSRKNIDKQHIRVQKIIKQLYDVRMDNTNKVIADILSTNPEYIAIEDINSTEMQDEANRTNAAGFATAISQTWLYTFQKRLKERCAEEGVELREINKWYPSTQLCSECGAKKPMGLNERTYVCTECGNEMDRDLNASYNIRDCQQYRVIVQPK